MLLAINNLKCHIAAQYPDRYALNTIALTKDGTVSANPYMVMLVPYPTVEPADVPPKLKGVDGNAPAPDAPVLVSLEDAAKAAAMPPSKSFNPAHGFIHAEVKKDKVTFGATNGSGVQTMTVAQPYGSFPDYGACVPDFSNARAISFTLEYLLRLLKEMKAASKETVVTLRFIDDLNGVGLSMADGVTAMIMPAEYQEKGLAHVPDGTVTLRAHAQGAHHALRVRKKPMPPEASQPETPQPETPRRRRKAAVSVPDAAPVNGNADAGNNGHAAPAGNNGHGHQMPAPTGKGHNGNGNGSGGAVPSVSAPTPQPSDNGNGHASDNGHAPDNGVSAEAPKRKRRVKVEAPVEPEYEEVPVGAGSGGTGIF